MSGGTILGGTLCTMTPGEPGNEGGFDLYNIPKITNPIVAITFCRCFPTSTGTIKSDYIQSKNLQVKGQF